MLLSLAALLLGIACNKETPTEQEKPIEGNGPVVSFTAVIQQNEGSKVTIDPIAGLFFFIPPQTDIWRSLSDSRLP